MQPVIRQTVKQPPASHCPNLNCPLQVHSLCMHVSCSSPSCNLTVLHFTWKNYQIHNILVGPKCWHHSPLIFGLNSMQRVVSTCHCGKSIGFWKCWYLLVKNKHYAGCTTKKKGHFNPLKLPESANHLHAKDQMAASDDSPGLVSGSHLMVIMRI